MVNIDFPPTTRPYRDPAPYIPINPFPERPNERLRKRITKSVRKGILIEFDDGSWEFIATDDECYKKLKEVLQ